MRLIVWREDCEHTIEPDIAELVERCGTGVTVINGAHSVGAPAAAA